MITVGELTKGSFGTTVAELIHKLQQLDEDMMVSYQITVFTDNKALLENRKAYERDFTSAVDLKRDFTSADEWSRIKQECERIHK